VGIKGIDNVGIAVRDLDAVAGFFEHTVGLDVTRDDEGRPRSASVQTGDRYLYVFETGGGPAPVQRGGDLTTNSPGLDHVSFAVDDVDGAYASLRRRGVPFEGEPESVDAWGIRLVRFCDPEGNAYYLVQSL
jgi:catechol 2,3-dioxygenase-like lactoylglutathione lyase family enzyme